MAQLGTTHIGWENEHLAEFLLSQIAFLSQPITIGDDVGTDYFCTLFEARQQNGCSQLFPLNSFAIQIKSGDGTASVKMDNKIEYLQKLEVPFFLGFVDRDKLELSIFSGEHLSAFFVMPGKFTELDLVPIETLSLKDLNEDLNKAGKEPTGPQRLRMPLVAKLNVSDPSPKILENRLSFKKICVRAQLNIAARINNEHIYRLDDTAAFVVAGSGSAQTFRTNFCWRLTEAFKNIIWGLTAAPSLSLCREFEIYERCYLELRDAGIADTPMLRDSYVAAKAIFAGSPSVPQFLESVKSQNKVD